MRLLWKNNGSIDLVKNVDLSKMFVLGFQKVIFVKSVA